jgi:hypothetical protein
MRLPVVFGVFNLLYEHLALLIKHLFHSLFAIVTLNLLLLYIVIALVLMVVLVVFKVVGIWILLFYVLHCVGTPVNTLLRD